MIAAIFRRMHSFPLATLAIAASVSPVSSQQPDPAPATLLAHMEGRWAVEQTTWDGPGTPAKKGPPAIALRRFPAGAGFVEEEMTVRDAGEKPFTRSARINYNITAKAFEYSTVDTRAPQQMHYISQPTAAAFSGTLAFGGGTFIAAEWGGKKEVAFAYRIELSPVTESRQRLQIFFKPLAGRGSEFLATQYDYRRL